MINTDAQTRFYDDEPEQEDTDTPYKELVAALICAAADDPGWALATLLCQQTTDNGRFMTNAAIAERLSEAGLYLSQDWYAEKVRLLRVVIGKEYPTLGGEA